MRREILMVLLCSAALTHSQSNQTDASLARSKQAQIFQSQGFQPVFCFAGQVKIIGKRLSRSPFSVLTANDDMKCCGTPVRSGRTDQHGHFLIEPLPQGRYFAKFVAGGQEELVAFAVVPGYEHCDGTHLEINFSKTGNGTIQDHIDINDSGEPCQQDEPHCYRK